MTTTTCPHCKNSERIHYYQPTSTSGLVTRCGACNWRVESDIPSGIFARIIQALR